MSSTFREFVFENRNSISVILTLEAPVGTPITTEVAGMASVTLNPNVNDVRAVMIKVVASGHEHTDVETLELGGRPHPMFFKTLRARSSIGSIHGEVSAEF